MKIIGIIPARWSSSRFPGKPLAAIAGKSMIQRVWLRARQSRMLDRIVVATDDLRIAQACSAFGAEYVLTDSELPTGTDRVYHAFQALQYSADIVVNIQGDEPVFEPRLLDSMLERCQIADADVYTAVRKISKIEDVMNENIVKAVVASNGSALYFSRSPIPFIRGKHVDEWAANHLHFQHIGIYAYIPTALQRFAELPPSPLEQAESLEQLRLLEDGKTFCCVETHFESIAVDKPSDILKVERYLRETGTI